MSFVEVSKRIMSGEKIYNLPLRVCFYARVSTDSDVQLNSLENQLNYYKAYIESKSNWTYVDGYVDEGVSGVRVEKRKSFQKMIRDARLHRFDLIITKEVSRFARDLEDSIHYIRLLKESDVGIYFENQNLNTFDTNSELILNIMFNLAQDESRKLSSRVKFGHREAIRKGHVLGSSNIIGYKKDNCRLVIDHEEAKFILKVFELYATGEYGFYKLSKKLSSLGFFNRKGNLYDKDTLKRIIENPKYKGFYRGKTSEVIDYRTKKRVKINEANQIIYKCSSDIVPNIVSEELWDKANDILKKRTKNYLNNNFSGGLNYPFSSKIYCMEHNTVFQRSHGSRKKSRPIWSCSTYLQYGVCSCISPIIAEKDLYNIMYHIVNSAIPEKEKIIDDMFELYKSIGESNQYEKELSEINNNIRIVEDKKTRVLDLVLNGDLKMDELKVQFERFEKELVLLFNKRNQVLDQIKILSEIHDNSDKMYELIKEEIDGGFVEEFTRKFVDEIIVSKIDGDRYNIHLDIFLNLLGIEVVKTKGARHINSATDDMLFMKNEICNSIEVLRSDRKLNKYTYNIYIENL